MNSTLSPQRPATLEDEWDNPAMAQFKRDEQADREAFGHSAEAQEWLRRLRAGELGWDWTVQLAQRIPTYDRAPVPLYKR